MENPIKQQIYDYIKSNPGCDSVDIISEFGKLAMPVLVLGTVGELIKENKVERYAIGIRYGYKIIVSDKKGCQYFDTNLCKLGLNGEDCPYIYTDNIICG
jgi:hypothetical protein